jgi:hypothetical protein
LVKAEVAGNEWVFRFEVRFINVNLGKEVGKAVFTVTIVGVEPKLGLQRIVFMVLVTVNGYRSV